MPLILVVEDNPDMLFILEMSLELNGYRVLTATNGERALHLLKNLVAPPDLIVSDVVMPIMNGYDFFHQVSKDSRWHHVPFIFLSALASPEDVRFGKMLGVDDYITKPFKDEDLLATVTGKLAMTRRRKIVGTVLEEQLFPPTSTDGKPGEHEMTSVETDTAFQVFMAKTTRKGPELTTIFPEKEHFPPSLEKLGIWLFNNTVAIYNREQFTGHQGIVFRIKPIEKDCFIYFDHYSSEEQNGLLPFTVTVLAPVINYFVSLKIEEYVKKMADLVKMNEKLDTENYRYKIVNNLATLLA
ncbi:MAG: PleD family two-component system response regulator [Candidatus Odinarchaeota archaeon]